MIAGASDPDQSHFTFAAANEGDVSAKTRWHKDKGMLPSNFFEVLSTL